MKQSWIQLITYLFIAAIGTVVDISLLYILTEFFHSYYLVSATISFLSGSVIVFKLSKKYAFKNQNKRVLLQYGVFLLIVLGGLTINLVTIFVLVEKFGWWYMYGKLVAIGLSFIWNYSGNTLVTFRMLK
jgi:dolichol-phosphate mannosyltransferase